MHTICFEPGAPKYNLYSAEELEVLALYFSGSEWGKKHTVEDLCDYADKLSISITT